jgi:hypothetical protein
MDVAGLLRQSFDDLHRELRDNLAEIPDDSLFWQPAPRTNHIGFELWHLVRDEDTMISDMTGVPQVWSDGGWGSRLSLENLGEVATLPTAQAIALRFELATFLEYAEAVWQRTIAAVPAFTEDRLDHQAWPGWNVARSLVEGSIGHSWMHLGAIRYVMGLRGWQHAE